MTKMIQAEKQQAQADKLQAKAEEVMARVRRFANATVERRLRCILCDRARPEYSSSFPVWHRWVLSATEHRCRPATCNGTRDKKQPTWHAFEVTDPSGHFVMVCPECITDPGLHVAVNAALTKLMCATQGTN